MRRIRYAEYEQDEQTHHHKEDIRTGKVTVYYTDGTLQEFEGIKWTEFGEWEGTHWDWQRPPHGVTIKPPRLHYTRQAVMDEADEQENASGDRRRRRMQEANAELEKRIGTEEYRRRFPGNVPPSEEASTGQPTNTRTKTIKEMVDKVRQKLNEWHRERTKSQHK